MNIKQKKIVNQISWVLFIVYIVLLAYFLFFSERYGRTAGTEYRYNLTLFKEIRRFIMYRKNLGIESFIVNIFGNVFAFIPFGFVLPIISPNNRKFLNITLLSFELTVTIEIMQLLLKVGIFDIDDIFMNTCGGILGYLCFYICYKVIKRRKCNE